MKILIKLILSIALLHFFLPYIISTIYNDFIAYEFNLPTFSYWFFFLIMSARFIFRLGKAIGNEIKID